MAYKVVGWVFGVLIASLAVGSIFNGAAASVVMLVIAAALLLPPIRAAVFERTNIKIPGLARFILVLLLFVGAMGITPEQEYRDKVAANDSHQKSIEAHSALEDAPVPPIAAEIEKSPAPDEGDWKRSGGVDYMTDEGISVLSLRSANSVEFDFPYKVRGGSHLTLSFRKKGNSLDAYMKIDKGQMLCNVIDCAFGLRVGEGSVQRWTGLESSTHDSDIMFVRDARQLESIIKRGGLIRISIEFYQSGSRVFYFNTAGYPGFN